MRLIQKQIAQSFKIVTTHIFFIPFNWSAADRLIPFYSNIYIFNGRLNRRNGKCINGDVCSCVYHIKSKHRDGKKVVIRKTVKSMEMWKRRKKTRINWPKIILIERNPTISIDSPPHFRIGLWKLPLGIHLIKWKCTWNVTIHSEKCST